jgi:hypothetical protein
MRNVLRSETSTCFPVTWLENDAELLTVLDPALSSPTRHRFSGRIDFQSLHLDLLQHTGPAGHQLTRKGWSVWKMVTKESFMEIYLSVCASARYARLGKQRMLLQG